MVRAFVLYEGEAPEADRYEQHNRDFSNKVPGATFRHGGVFGAAVGEPKYKYYAEFEWADMDAFKAAHPKRGVRRDRQGRDGDGHPVQRPLRRVVTEPSRLVRLRSTRPSSASSRSSTRRRRRARRSASTGPRC